MSNKLISVHVAKAGGSALRHVLRQHFGPAYADDYLEDPANPLSQRNLDPQRHIAQRQAIPDDAMCVHGHLHPGKYAPGDYVLATVLRHPVDNIISIYSFWMALGPGSHGALFDYFRRTRPPIAETARFPLLRRLLSHTYFGGFDMSRFDLIGRHEDRADALRRLSALVGAPLDPNVRENVTAPSTLREEMQDDPSLRRALQDILIDDVRFYDRWAR